LQGKDSEEGSRDGAGTPAEDRSTSAAPTLQSEDKFERSSRGEMAGGLRDGERNRMRRKETGSWADEADDDFKTYSSEMDGRQSSRRDDGRGSSQYSRQDRRKSFNVISCCVVP